MELRLARTHKLPAATTGILYIGEQFECYICEDTVRNPNERKVPGQTAIPAGRYEIVITWSNRFKRMLPLLLNVPDFEGIRIHPGNTAADTEGCLLPGKTRDIAAGTVQLSKAAFEQLFTRLDAACKQEKVYISIDIEE